MTQIKKNDFIEIEYTGKLVEDGFVFDTTNQDVAKENNIYNPKAKYEPSIVCVGQNQLLIGLDKDVVGKETGKEYTIKISVEEGFGKKSAKLIQLVPASKFKKDNIRPIPGLQVDIDGKIGVVKTVTGGRVMIDFNNPLAGKDLEYVYIVKGIVDDNAKKVSSYLTLAFNFPVKAEEKDKVVEVELPFKMPDNIVNEISEKLKEIVSDKIEYVFKAKQIQQAAPANPSE